MKRISVTKCYEVSTLTQINKKTWQGYHVNTLNVTL